MIIDQLPSMQGQGLYKGSKNAPEITQVMTEEISHLLKRPRSAGLFHTTVPIGIVH